MIFGDCAPGTAGSLALEFRSSAGRTQHEVAIPAADNACGETIRLLRGSRLITDAEARLGAKQGPGAKRAADSRLDYLERLSREYSLASRAMALVAVVERPGDRPGEPPQTHVVPVGLPQDMQFEGVFQTTLYQFAQPPSHRSSCLYPRMLSPLILREEASLDFQGEMNSGSYDQDFATAEVMEYAGEEPATISAGGAFDRLVELSARLEADGGMPGKTDRDRIIASLISLLAFLADGHDLHHGAFRVHVGRLIDFLDRALPDGLPPEEVQAAGRVIEAVRAGKAIEGEWAAAVLEACEGDTGALNRAWQEFLRGGSRAGSV